MISAGNQCGSPWAGRDEFGRDRGGGGGRSKEEDDRRGGGGGGGGGKSNRRAGSEAAATRAAYGEAGGSCPLGGAVM